MNYLSGGYFVTAAECVFDNRLLQSVAASAPSINTGLVLATGATQLRGVFKGQELAAILAGYMARVKDGFAWSWAGAAFTAALALVVPFKKMPPVEDVSAKEKTVDGKEETIQT